MCSPTQSSNRTAPPNSAPHLPADVIGCIAQQTTHFSDLNALRMVSKSWRIGCGSVMDEVRAMALDSTWRASEPLLRTQTCLAFAQDYAQMLLSEPPPKDFNPGKRARLSRTLPQLWKLNGKECTFREIAHVFFNMRGLDAEGWKLLLELSVPRLKALSMLALDPDACNVIRNEDWQQIRQGAVDTLEAYLESDPIGGGALCDYPIAIKRFGEKTSPPYCSPFHRILFASLVYQPKAFHPLIQMAAQCNGSDFCEFSARVRLHFKHDSNIQVSLNLATAKWLCRESEEVLSSIHLDVRANAINRVYQQYLWTTDFSAEQKQIVEPTRHEYMMAIARNAAAIVRSIPAEKPGYREAVLKPLMDYLRSESRSNEQAKRTMAAIQKQARLENWLANNPKLKF